MYTVKFATTLIPNDDSDMALLVNSLLGALHEELNHDQPTTNKYGRHFSRLENGMGGSLHSMAWELKGAMMTLALMVFEPTVKLFKVKAGFYVYKNITIKRDSKGRWWIDGMVKGMQLDYASLQKAREAIILNLHIDDLSKSMPLNDGSTDTMYDASNSYAYSLREHTSK
jgi:hypothetical protein